MKLALTMGLVVALCATVVAEDWPQFRGIRADAISREKGINKDWNKRPPKLLWKVPVGDDGYAGPAVAGGKVFYVDHQGNDDIVKAVNLSDGKEVWRYSYPEAEKPNWGFARATPNIHKGKVYTFSRLGTLNCLDEKTGKLVWSVNVIKDLGGTLPHQWDASASPVIDGQKLIVVTGVPDSPVAALDKDTGKVIWQGGAKDAPAHSTPVIATLNGKKQCIVFLGYNLQGIDPETGAGIWKYKWPSGNIAEPIVIGGNSVFVATSYNVGCGLIGVKGNDAKEIWKSQDMSAHFNTPVLIGGYLYGTGDPGHLACLEAKTGKVMWKQNGFEKGGVVAIDGTLIVVNGSNGDVTMVQITHRGYKERGKMTGLGGQSWSPPVISSGKLIVRNKRTIACYDLK